MGGDPGSKVRRWLTFGTFVLLGVLALGVFLWLPDWVRKRNEAEGRKASASGPVAEVEATQKSPEAPVDAAALEPERSAGLGGAPETSASQGPAPAAEEEIFDPAPPETAQQVAGVVRVEPAVQVEPSSKAEFRRMMSEGLAALANGESAQAKEAFQRALLLSPGSSEATDGLSQAEEDQRIAAISEHRARAAEFEKNEDWESALREYNAVFALDPTIRFAREGKARAEVRSQLAEQL